MRGHHFAACVPALLVFVVSSCQCGSSSPVEAYCAELASVHCQALVNCGSLREEDADVCEDAFRENQCGALVDRVTRGYSTFDQAAADRCLELTRTSVANCAVNGGVASPQTSGPDYCGDWEASNLTPPPPSCGAEAIAATPHLGACRESRDCALAEDSCAGDGCARTCQAAGGLNAPCSRFGACDQGLTCDVTTLTCVPGAAVGEACDFFRGCDSTAGFCTTAGHCAPLGSEGASCPAEGCGPGLVCLTASHTCARFVDEGEPCQDERQCASPLLCLSGTCSPRKAEGVSCTSHRQCVPGLFCSNGVCAQKRGEGAACEIDKLFPFISCACASGLACDPVLRTCETPVVVPGGADCNVIPGTQFPITRRCDDEHVCVGATSNPDGGTGTFGTCVPKRLGDACDDDFDCPHAAFCERGSDGGTGQCAAAFDGSQCLADRNCVPGQFCAGNLCRPLIRAGQACTISFDSHCAPGLSCLMQGAGAICAAPAGEGEACDETIAGACRYPFACVGDRCVEAGRPGQACLSSGGCIEGACDANSRTCSDRLADGAACVWNSECASGWCDTRKCQPGCAG